MIFLTMDCVHGAPPSAELGPGLHHILPSNMCFLRVDLRTPRRGREEDHGGPGRFRVRSSQKLQDAELSHQGTFRQPEPSVVTKIKIKNCIDSWVLLKTDPLSF